MPIEGPIRELAPSDLLQLLHLSRRTGRLTVRPAADGEVVLLLKEGALVGASGVPELRLGRLLVQSGRATASQIERALARQAEAPGRRLGALLVEDGVARASEIERQLRFQVEESVFDLMRLEEGDLRFEEEPVEGGGPIAVALATDAVLMNAARRLDEYAEVLSGIATGDPLPRLATPPDAGEATLFLQPGEWEVLAEVDGERTLREIARSIGRGELEVARALYGLVAAGVVEVGGRGEGGDAGPSAALAAIEGAIREGRRAEAEALLEGLSAAGAVDESDPVLLQLRGRLAALREEWDDAAAALRASAERDPLRAPTHFHLARALVRGGALEGAQRALVTYERLDDPSASRKRSAARLRAALDELLAASKEGEP